MTKETTEFKILNKHLMMTRHHPKAPWSLEANLFEAAKAYVIAAASGRLKAFLPYTVEVSGWPRVPDEWPLRFWAEGLTADNAPGKFQPSIDPERFRRSVEPLDFSKPYDDTVVISIRAQFQQGASAPVTVDAAEIEQEATQ